LADPASESVTFWPGIAGDDFNQRRHDGLGLFFPTRGLWKLFQPPSAPGSKPLPVSAWLLITERPAAKTFFGVSVLRREAE
jgi:hypothetical protein